MWSRKESGRTHLILGSRSGVERKSGPVLFLQIRDWLSVQTGLKLDADKQGRFQRGDNVK